MSSRAAVFTLSDEPLPREEVLPWLKKEPSALRAEERLLVETLAANTGAPKKQIREFVRSFMKK